MNAWSGLFKKEFRLGLPAVSVGLSFLFGCLGVVAFLSWKYSQPAFLAALCMGVVVAHVLYVPMYVIFSFYAEHEKMHLWLHLPHTGRFLLSAKYLSGAAAMVISMIIPIAIVLLMGKGVLEQLTGLELGWRYSFLFMGFTFFHILAASLYLSVWLGLLWTVSRSLAPIFAKLRWPVVIVLVIVGMWLAGLWEETAFFAMLTEWGTINIDFSRLLLNIEGDSFTIETGASDSVYIGSYLYYSVVGILVYLASGWLLDHKVEV